MNDIMTFLTSVIDFLFPVTSQQGHIEQAWLPLVSLALMAASTGYGMYKKGQASKEMREANEKIQGKYSELSDWYGGESSKDFMDTEVAKSTLGKIREQYKKGVETNVSDAARGGATAEAQVANKAALNEKYNQVLSNMTGYGTEYKLNLKQQYQNALSSLASQQNATYGADVASWGNLAGNAGAAFANTAATTDWEKMFGGGKFNAQNIPLSG